MATLLPSAPRLRAVSSRAPVASLAGGGDPPGSAARAISPTPPCPRAEPGPHGAAGRTACGRGRRREARGAGRRSRPGPETSPGPHCHQASRAPRSRLWAPARRPAASSPPRPKAAGRARSASSRVPCRVGPGASGLVAGGSGCE